MPCLNSTWNRRTPFAAASCERRRRMESRLFSFLPKSQVCLFAATVMLAGLADAQETLFGLQSTQCASQSSVHVNVTDDLVTVKACDVTIRDVLHEIAQKSALVVVLHDPPGERITLDIERVPLTDALDRILRHQSFALRYADPAGSSTESSKLWVFSDGTDDAAEPAAVEILGRANVDVSSLSNALADDNAKTRLHAISTLSTAYNDHGAAALAAAALSDGDVAVREEAVYVLSEIGGEAGTQLIGQALMDPDSRVREAAVEAFADMGGERSAQALAIVLYDDDPALREDAVYALDEIGGATANALLQQALADQDSSVREAAAQLLAEISRQEPME